MKVRVKTGDIFQIPIGDETFCFGQVLENNKGVLRIATFDGLYNLSDDLTIEQIFSTKIVLLTDTMDAKIWNGEWKVYLNASIVDKALPRPHFKVGLDPEEGTFDHKFSVAPIRVENAMKAYFKLTDWHPDFDRLTYNYCAEKSNVLI